VHSGKLEQVTNFTKNWRQCVDQYMVLFRYCSPGSDTDVPGGLHARLCCASLLSLAVLLSDAVLWV